MFDHFWKSVKEARINGLFARACPVHDIFPMKDERKNVWKSFALNK